MVVPPTALCFRGTRNKKPEFDLANECPNRGSDVENSQVDENKASTFGDLQPLQPNGVNGLRLDTVLPGVPIPKGCGFRGGNRHKVT
jgi:hypothetical protein